MQAGSQSTSVSVRRGRTGRRLGVGALAAFALLGGLAAPAQAATSVLWAAPAAVGVGDCSSSANACSITTAVTNANAAPTTDDVLIELAGGTYSQSTVLAITFAGPSLTLEADGGTPVLDAGHATQLLSVDAASDVTIDGLAFVNGTPSGNARGGAIVNHGTLTVLSSTFSDNRTGNGGAISNEPGSTLDVEDTTFSDNSAIGTGGGAIITYSTMTVARSAFFGNFAAINGGAINVQPSSVTTVSSSTFSGSSTAGQGGALSSLGQLTVEGSTIVGSSASAGSAIASSSPANATFATTIIAAQTSGDACNSVPFVDAGYNLDTDGTCISDTTPGTGSHDGTTAYGSSTYAAALGAYLADAPADNGGPTETFALLATPDPATTLANPALLVVPPSFVLPVAVDGATTACSVPDQRGRPPVPGINCDIGAFLLQTTTTDLGSSGATVEQNASVTYTATVTPAASSGTVSFSDGAGNPATTGCAAQTVSGGVATCTVSYPNAGTYSVTATFSGDGYPASTSVALTQTVVAPALAPAGPAAPAAPAAPVVPAAHAAVVLDLMPPTTTVRRVTSVKQPITLRGTARDAGGVHRVRVSVSRKVGKLCRFLRADGTFSSVRDCDATPYLNAHGTKTWTLKLRRLPPGRYAVWARGIDVAGNVERKARTRNVTSFRIAVPKKATKKKGSRATALRVVVLPGSTR